MTRVERSEACDKVSSMWGAGSVYHCDNPRGSKADLFQGASGYFTITEVRHGDVVWGEDAATRCRACQHTAPLKAFGELGRRREDE